jgi:hypothetical protein
MSNKNTDEAATVETTTPEQTEVQSNFVTPYEAARVVNGWLKDRGVDKQLPQQMFYNYTQAKVNKGEKPMIPVVLTEANKVQIDREALATWFEKYFTKNWVPRLQAATKGEDTENTSDATE